MVVPPRRRQRGSSMSMASEEREKKRGREEFFRLTTECRLNLPLKKAYVHHHHREADSDQSCRPTTQPLTTL